MNMFFEELKQHDIYGYIAGGKTYNYYFNMDESTIDTDIHIYITYSQLKEKNTFQIIYNTIKNLYRYIKKKFPDLLPLPKFDCPRYSLKYIDKSLVNKLVEYYHHSVIADIQFENLDETLFDISVSVCSDIDNIKNKIDNNYYLKKDDFVKSQYKYLDDLLRFNKYKNENKINKIKNRLKYIKSTTEINNN